MLLATSNSITSFWGIFIIYRIIIKYIRMQMKSTMYKKDLLYFPFMPLDYDKQLKYK